MIKMSDKQSAILILPVEGRVNIRKKGRIWNAGEYKIRPYIPHHTTIIGMRRGEPRVHPDHSSRLELLISNRK
jgi:hypothetical protein